MYFAFIVKVFSVLVKISTFLFYLSSCLKGFQLPIKDKWFLCFLYKMKCTIFSKTIKAGSHGSSASVFALHVKLVFADDSPVSESPQGTTPHNK